MRHILTIFLLLLPCLLCAKPKALPPPVVPQCFGVNIHFTGAPQRDLDGLAQGGFGWVRMDFAWADIERTRGNYDFAQYDSLLAGLTARHLKPLFILDYGNDLYQTGSPRSPEARAAFARFAAASAQHYRGQAILWELWNEPNGSFWKPNPNAQEYGALALAAAHAIRAVDADATVIAPGTSGIPLDFLDDLFRQGLLQEVDAVSVHPYRPAAPETAGDDYQALRQLIHKYAPGRDIPLVSSEWGYPTFLTFSEQQQAQYLAREWLFNLSEDVRLSIWYDWHDDGQDPANAEDHFGTVHADYSPKPAFLAARTLARTFNGYRFIKRVPLTSLDDYLLLFAHGTDSVKIAAWTAGREHTILLPIRVVGTMTGMTGESMPTAPTAGRLSLTLTGSPVYLGASSDAALRQAASWTAASPEMFYTQGQPLPLALTYRNPDGIPHRVRFVALLTTPDGMRTPVPAGEDIVGPHQTLTLGMQAPAPAGSTAVIRVGLVLDGIPQPYPQDVAFAPLTPLALTVAPLTANHIQVLINNPSGLAFVGSLSAVGSSGITSVPVRLTAGQKAATVIVAIQPTANTSWRLRDRRGRLASSLPEERLVPYPLNLSDVQPLPDDSATAVPAVQITQSNVEGTQRVRYRFTAGQSSWQIGEEQPLVLPGQPTRYGLWVFGDADGDQLSMEFEDSTGQSSAVDGGRVTWTGWRFVTFPLHGGNTLVEFPIKITALLRLRHDPDSLTTAGTLLWKEPTIIYEALTVPHRV